MARRGHLTAFADDWDDDEIADDDPSEFCSDCGAGFDQPHEDDCTYAGLDDDEDEFDDPDPDADLQGLRER